ncbi:sensor histidine kinase [Flavihumibacter fluvii]|uniref:sensor histidine kinase n=1 Tax=Flavihumibacter fluvii TaxID=2838157 RepID=UPI001BDF3129|nr:histidine kinase [Flavihumibacter fluvii]ULQ51019.1 histidine kinase [Flavihumibacter fluvii]
MPTIPFSHLTLKLLTGIIIYLVWQLNFVVLLQSGYGIEIAFIESMVNLGILTLANMTILQIFRYYNPPSSKFWMILSITAVFSILLPIMAKLIIPLLYSGNTAYTDFLNSSTYVRINISMIVVEFIVVLNLLWNSLQEELKSGSRRQEIQGLAREAELFKLRQQLQPHFLFNSLNSINAMVVSRPQEARKMIEQLSTFLRATINRKEDEMVPYREEMEQIDRYLQIEKLRFGHRLNTIITTAESCDTAQLPPLLLQPIVENSIKFGLYDTTGNVTIEIQSRCENGSLTITVTNPFDPETSPDQKGTGFGLSAVQRRLYLLFGRQDLLAVSTEHNHFITTINIPQIYANRHNN